MNVYLEIFGYIGTALVIVSMMMTSVLKLRIINMAGGIISLIYAIFCNTWPVVVLNLCLICVNFIQTLRELLTKKNFSYIKAITECDGLNKFILSNKKEIEKLYPDFIVEFSPCKESILFLCDNRIVGAVVLSKKESVSEVDLFYVSPRFRNDRFGEFISSIMRGNESPLVNSKNNTQAFGILAKRMGIEHIFTSN